jgi:alpha-D-ribose 1-methylphosphonate 5-triphosphate synthase subunit PhnH
MTEDLTAGFADPVHDSQRCFRALLTAMSRPGLVQPAGAALAPPAPLQPAAAAVALALLDADTPVWLDAGPAAARWLGFHTGCPVVDAPGAAAFLLATGPAPRLADLAAGSEEAPETGATLILQVESLAEGTGWRLTGPGIETEHRLAVTGLPADFVAQWAGNRRRFPRGIDIVLCVGDRLAALPRTVRIEETR